MKLTESQQAEYRILEQQRLDVVAKFQHLKGDAFQEARNAYYIKRQ